MLEALPRDAAAQPSSIASGDAPAILEQIHAPYCGLAIWNRSIPEDMADALDRVAETLSLDIHVTVAAAHIGQALDATLPPSDAEGAALRFLRDDVAMLVARFAALSGSSEVEMRVETIAHDACRKFHYDQVPFRLIVTYAGEATQWVPAEEAEKALAAQQDYDGEVLAFPRTAVCLFKGAGSAENPVLHRSPPIAHLGTRRLVLCLNGPSAIAPPLWTP